MLQVYLALAFSLSPFLSPSFYAFRSLTFSRSLSLSRSHARSLSLALLSTLSLRLSALAQFLSLALPLARLLSPCGNRGRVYVTPVLRLPVCVCPPLSACLVEISGSESAALSMSVSVSLSVSVSMSVCVRLE